MQLLKFSEKMSPSSTYMLSSLVLIWIMCTNAAKNVDPDFAGTQQREGPGMTAKCHFVQHRSFRCVISRACGSVKEILMGICYDISTEGFTYLFHPERIDAVT